VAFKRKPSVAIEMSTHKTLRVLFEDNHIVAVNKRNSDIIQGDKSGDTVLSDIVNSYVKEKYKKPGKAFIAPIHRLDRPVSGVVLFARTTKALNRLMKMFRFREVQKTYWAVVKDKPPKQEDTVINYLLKNEKKNKSYASDKPSDSRKECELSYRVVGKSERYYFLEIYPKTGRHHQIRATMEQLGCPIKGDVKYGFDRTNPNASIHLHARKIEFIHPVKKELMSIVAPPPLDPLWNEFLKQMS